VHIVLLELFMDIGASVAFVSEPGAPDAMARAPRDPARRFLDRVEVGAIGLTAVALTAAVLPAFLLVRAGFGTEAASAAAVAAWLVAHGAIAWSLRTRPRLSWRGNMAFPAWALVATATALIFALTPAAAALGIEPLTAGAIGITAAAAAAGVAVAAAGRRALSLSSRL
jgi:Ca2+-transporting ATPase